MADLPVPVVELTDAPRADATVPASEHPTLSIVLVTFGTGQVVVDALRSIVDHTDANLTPYEIIVVDNPSDGYGTADLLTATTCGVRLVRSAKNVGFGPANDVGAAVARGTLLCLCNPDIVVPAGWLPPLVRALDDAAIGIAAPLLVNPDGTLQEAGQLLYDDGNTAAIGGAEVLTGDWGQAFTRDVDYASAAFWLLRQPEYLGFNPRLVPAYFEDVDYALRLEQRGQVTRLVVDQPVVHLHGGSSDTAPSSIAERSREVFRSEWADRIAMQPARPATPLDAIESRDRSCLERVVVIGSPAHATALARQEPRSRVALLADHIADDEVLGLRRAGVEVCAGPPAQTLTERPGWATQVRTVGRPPRSLKTAVRRHQPGVREITRLSGTAS